MNQSILCGVLLSAAVAMPPVSGAQASSPPGPGPSGAAATGPASDPLEAQARLPALTVRSSLSDYRPYREAEVGHWRQLNDTVRNVGGWRAYARLSQEPDGVEGAKPTPSGHAGHGH